jgi:hypothetical protein
MRVHGRLPASPLSHSLPAALGRIRLCEATGEILDPFAERLRAALARLRQVPEDLGEAYELVYAFIRKGGKLPVYARRVCLPRIWS